MITLQDVQRGYDAWAAKPHNAKWVRKIDGTPIPNDIVVNIFEALKDGGQSIAHKDGCDFKHSPITLCDCPASEAEEAPEDRLYDAEAFMADGEIQMTAAENVLAWLLIEKIGVPDDVGYSPKQAQEIIVRQLDQLREFERADPQPASTALVERLAKALQQITSVKPEVSNERFRFFALATADAALAASKEVSDQ